MCEIAQTKVLASLLFLFIFVFAGNVKAQQADSSSTWLKVIVNLEQYYLVIDDDFNNPNLIQRGDSIQVEPGKHKVTIVWQTISDNTSTLTFKPGTTKTHRVYISSFYRSPRSSFDVILNQENLRITTDKGASIYIDGEYMGKHTVATLVNPGERKITTEHPKHGKLTKTISVDTYNVIDFARFNENPSNLSFAGKLVPGAEYIASKRYARAVVSIISLGALTGNLIRTNIQYNDKEDDFNYWEKRYQTSNNTRDLLQFRENVLQAEDDLQQVSREFNITLLVLGTVYLLSTFDAFRKPRSGYKGKSFFSNSEFSVVPKQLNNQTYPLLTYHYFFN